MFFKSRRSAIKAAVWRNACRPLHCGPQVWTKSPQSTRWVWLSATTTHAFSSVSAELTDLFLWRPSWISLSNDSFKSDQCFRRYFADRHVIRNLKINNLDFFSEELQILKSVKTSAVLLPSFYAKRHQNKTWNRPPPVKLTQDVHVSDVKLRGTLLRKQFQQKKAFWVKNLQTWNVDLKTTQSFSRFKSESQKTET